MKKTISFIFPIIFIGMLAGCGTTTPQVTNSVGVTTVPTALLQKWDTINTSLSKEENSIHNSKLNIILKNYKKITKKIIGYGQQVELEQLEVAGNKARQDLKKPTPQNILSAETTLKNVTIELKSQAAG